jgi:heat shock protein HslJ
LAAAGCSGDDSSGSGSADASKLVGKNWVLTTEIASGVSPSVVAVSARFAKGSVSGDSGCNNYNAPYKVDGSAMTIGPNIATTLRACEPDLTAVEHAYLALLPKVASYEIKGQTLSLRASSGKALLVYEAASAAGLIGKWTVTSYYTGDAVQSVLGGATLTAEFDKTRVSGDAGCNTFTGAYETKGETITIGPLATTRRACLDSIVANQEQKYVAALELATTYRLTGTRLDLFRADGGFAATFDRAS